MVWGTATVPHYPDDQELRRVPAKCRSGTTSSKTADPRAGHLGHTTQADRRAWQVELDIWFVSEDVATAPDTLVAADSPTRLPPVLHQEPEVYPAGICDDHHAGLLVTPPRRPILEVLASFEEIDEAIAEM